MKILLISNQGMTDSLIGNPIMLRMRDTLQADTRIEEVRMLRCKKPFSARRELRQIAKDVDVIHVHFGGAYAVVVWLLLIGINKPKFITFHGTDIHAKAIQTARNWREMFRIRLNQKSSFLSLLLFDSCGFVAKEMMEYIPPYLIKLTKNKCFIQPLGVDYNRFIPIDKEEAQEHLGLKPGKYILFSDVHNSKIKRRDIAESIVREIGGDYQLLIMCGVPFNEVPYYINACDFIILTSDEEGSPNIVREALSLNKPVFSVDVGDVGQMLDGLQNSCIISRNPQEAAISIKNHLNITYSDNTREKLSNKINFYECNKGVIDKYEEILKK